MKNPRGNAAHNRCNPFCRNELRLFRVPTVPLARQLNKLEVMKVAIAHWQGRVSPVFDVATRLLLVEVAGGRECGRGEVSLATRDLVQRAGELSRSGTDVLICGAISWPLEIAVSSLGIQIVPNVCGQVEEVLRAFLEDELSDPAFLMPGCCGRRRRFRGGGPFVPGPGEPCVCPKCGYKATYVRGQLCRQQGCPECGTKMSKS